MLLLQRLYEVYTLIFAQRACMDLLGNGGEGGGGGGGLGYSGGSLDKKVE